MAAEVWLLQAMGKGDRNDRIVKDATALGVRGIVWLATERTVVDIAGREESKRGRWRHWQKIQEPVKKFARQSQLR
jgi:RsmE family RNA methyltransferase